MRRNANKLASCANRFLCKNKIVARFLIEGGKMVSEPTFELRWRKPPPEELYPCITKVFNQIKFPVRGGQVKISIPLHYRCAGD